MKPAMQLILSLIW